MTVHAEVLAAAFCMSCGGLLTRNVRFRWGALPEQYQAGDDIRWWRGSDGSVEPAFRMLEGGGERWNFGDPSCVDLVVLDEITDSGRGVQCPICMYVYDGIAVWIRGGKIESAAPQKLGHIALLRGDSVEAVKAIQIKPDHSLCAREDWYWAAQCMRDGR
jgi:hypothetical protein